MLNICEIYGIIVFPNSYCGQKAGQNSPRISWTLQRQNLKTLKIDNFLFTEDVNLRRYFHLTDYKKRYFFVNIFIGKRPINVKFCVFFKFYFKNIFLFSNKNVLCFYVIRPLKTRKKQTYKWFWLFNAKAKKLLSSRSIAIVWTRIKLIFLFWKNGDLFIKKLCTMSLKLY